MWIELRVSAQFLARRQRGVSNARANFFYFFPSFSFLLTRPRRSIQTFESTKSLYTCVYIGIRIEPQPPWLISHCSSRNNTHRKPIWRTSSCATLFLDINFFFPRFFFQPPRPHDLSKVQTVKHFFPLCQRWVVSHVHVWKKTIRLTFFSSNSKFHRLCHSLFICSSRK